MPLVVLAVLVVVVREREIQPPLERVRQIKGMRVVLEHSPQTVMVLVVAVALQPLVLAQVLMALGGLAVLVFRRLLLVLLLLVLAAVVVVQEILLALAVLVVVVRVLSGRLMQLLEQQILVVVAVALETIFLLDKTEPLVLVVLV